VERPGDAPGLLRRYPRIRIAAINHRVPERPAQRAVAALDSAIRSGEPMRGERTLSRISETSPALHKGNDTQVDAS